jgi:hypothetical protein
MVKVIMGVKGTGKTKQMIEMINAAVTTENGNVVAIERGPKLTYDLSHKARLVAAEDYNVKCYGCLYGFIAGMCAGNYDITDIFVDSTLKIGGDDLEKLADMVEKLAKLEANITLSVSADKADIPARLADLAQEI